MELRRALLASVQDTNDNPSCLTISTCIKAPALDNNKSPFTLVVLNDNTVGISYNLFHSDPETMARYHEWNLHHLFGQPAGEVAPLILSDDLLERTIGFAVINALSQIRIKADTARYHLDDSIDLFSLLHCDASHTLGLVGYFRPLMNKLMTLTKRVIVVEKSETLLAGRYPFLMTDDPTALQQCNKILITGTTLINDSLPDLIPYCCNADFIAIMGPTAGFVPTPLFDLGIHAVGYSRIEDTSLFIERFTHGQKWGNSTRKVWLRAS
ncbi:MAG: hypothetical protein CSA26_08060 [Desulfobacterales bacterium]|nr:MAG: hypothetical protein CSA26_08060 [Desulfobacterales bacterium]